MLCSLLVYSCPILQNKRKKISIVEIMKMFCKMNFTSNTRITILTCPLSYTEVIDKLINKF